MTLTTRKLFAIWLTFASAIYFWYFYSANFQSSHPLGQFIAPINSLAAEFRARDTLEQSTEIPKSNDGTVQLEVITNPADATVRIMNIVPAYKAGIRLDPGRYDLEVSYPGYLTQRRWISIKAGNSQPVFKLSRR